ncbi:NUDIX hydrolase [Streptomyces anulatus]|uniref:NUDIX hydrolase n=1 Tax=Streptomyces anulatus TaxID=1892 RepID=UPI00386C7692
MPPARSHIRELVTAYLDRHPGERPALGPLLKALDAPSEITSRATLPGHITCSAVVIDHAGRVLHVRHNASGGLLAPGGHGEPDDATLMATAVREVHEETGIPPGLLCQSAAFCHEPADIDIHPIDANPAKGEPAHHHYDFRFVFRLVPPSVETALQAEEVSAAVWLPLDQVTSPTLREKLLGADLSAAPEPVNASVIIHDGALLTHVTTASPSWPALAVVERTADGTLNSEVRAVEFAHRAGHGVDRIWLTEAFRHRIATEPGAWTYVSARELPSSTDRGFWLAADHLLGGGLVRDFGAEHLALGAPGCGSWLRAAPGEQGWHVAAHGPRDIWAELHDLADRWRAAGSPDRYRLDFTEDGGQRVSSANGVLAWPLSAPNPVEEGAFS